MELRHRCTRCDGTGRTLSNNPYAPQTEIPCPHCGGKGYNADEMSFPEYDVLMEKLDEVKTKINQMQADINYIKAKL
jgi:excinuclease UvrABC ATPase subunit